MKRTISTRYQLVAFFVLTYVSSWSLFFVGHKTQILPIILVGIWAPSLTSIGLTAYFFGKKGLSQMFGRFKRFRIKWYWWLLLILLPASIHLAGVSLWDYLNPAESQLDRLYIAHGLGALLPSFLIAGFGEELGWRGFALPRLQRNFSPIGASFILAIVHLLWHLPTYWLGQGIHNVPFVYVLAFVFPWTFIFNWLYNKSGGSLIFAVGFHAISNASLSLVRFMPWEEVVPISPELITQLAIPDELGGPYLTVCAVYFVVAILVIVTGKFNRINTDIP
nr:type II CAAX endopeptidase family protein [uncultured Allomuricauda sp.]